MQNASPKTNSVQHLIRDGWFYAICPKCKKLIKVERDEIFFEDDLIEYSISCCGYILANCISYREIILKVILFRYNQKE